MANPVIGIDVQVKLDKFRAELAKIPNIGKKEIGTMVALMKRDLAGAEKAAAQAGKASAAAAKQVEGLLGRIPGFGALGQALQQLGIGAGGAGGSIAGMSFAAAGAVAGVAALAAGVVLATTSTVAFARELDAIGDSAKRAGVDAESYVLVTRQFRDAGVDAGSAETAILKLNRTIGDAREGSAEAQKAFARLGLDWDALATMPLPQQMELIADGMAGLGTQADRTSAITDVMGRSAAHLLPAFEGGAKGMRAAHDALRQYGTVSNDTVVQAQALDDAINHLGDTWVGLKAQALGPLIPVLTGVTEAMGTLLRTASDWHFGEVLLAVLAPQLAGDVTSDLFQQREESLRKLAAAAYNAARAQAQVIGEPEDVTDTFSTIPTRTPRASRGPSTPAAAPADITGALALLGKAEDYSAIREELILIGAAANRAAYEFETAGAAGSWDLAAEGIARMGEAIAKAEQQAEEMREGFSRIAQGAAELLGAIGTAAASGLQAHVDAYQAAANEIGKIDAALTDATTEGQRERLEAQKAAATEILKAEKDKARELFYAKKVAALGQAAINLALGITSIWSQFGPWPPVAIALTAIEAVVSGIQIGAIAGEQPGFHGGSADVDGLLPDEVSARLTRREAVATPLGADLLGRENIARANRGEPLGGEDRVVQHVWEGRVIHQVFRDILGQRGGPVYDAIAAGRPRVGARNPYARRAG